MNIQTGILGNDTKKYFASLAIALVITMASARAGTLVVSGSTLVETGTSYDSALTDTPALTVTGPGARYSGTDITLTGAGVTAQVANQGTLELHSSSISSAASTNGYGLNLLGNSSAAITSSTINTTGREGYGVNATGTSAVTLVSSVINTSGTNGYGVNTATSGTVGFTSGTINTTGYGAHGVRATGAGDVSLKGSTISTTGYYAHGVNATGTSTVSLANTPITTSGYSAFGVYAEAFSSIILENSTISTTGTNAAGMEALNNSHLTFTGGTISTSGHGVSGGVASWGVYATGTSTVTIDNSLIRTQGNNSTAVYAINFVTGTLTNTPINTTGDNAGGIYVNSHSTLTLTNTPISTQGYNANGVTAGGYSSVTITDRGTIRTLGDRASGITTSGQPGNVLNSGTVTVSSVDVKTSGSLARGVYASGGTVDLGTGSTITTEGASAAGIYTEGDTSLSYVHGTSITVTTTGPSSSGVSATGSGTVHLGMDSKITTHGKTANGIVANGPGNHVIGTSLAVTTNGDSSVGAYSFFGGTITLGAGSMVTTLGTNAHGLRAAGADYGVFLPALLDASSATVTTKGTGAAAAYASNGGVINLLNVSLSTQGDQAIGALLSGGANADGTINFNGDNTISTSGSEAHAISVQSGASKTFDGTPGNILPSITIAGANSAVLHATGTNSTTGAGSQLTLTGTKLDTAMTAGPGTWGAKAENSGTITFGRDSASGGTGLWSATGGSIVLAGNASAQGSRTRIDAGGILDITGAATGATIGSLEGAGSVHLGANTLTIGGYLTPADSASTIFTGAITGAGGLIKQGAGVLTLSGTAAFAYAGMTIINDGVLALRDIGNTFTFAKTITLNGGWLDLSDSRMLDGMPNEWNYLILLTGTAAQGDNARGGIIGANDKIAFDIPSGITSVDFHLGNDTVNIENADKRGLYLLKTGAGTLILTGSNEYIGNTRIENGILQVSRDENLGDTTVEREVVLGNHADAATSGTLRISGNIITGRHIELCQNGAVEVDAGVSTTWGGIDSRTAATPRTLTKTGAGALAINGASTLSGLIVDQGRIDLGAQTSITAAAAPAITMNSGTANIAGGVLQSATADLIVAASGSASELNLANLAATAAPGASLARATNGSSLALAATNAQLTGDITTDSSSAAKLQIKNATTFTGKIGTADVDIDASSLWILNASSTVGALKNQGRITFTPGAFKTLTLDTLDSATGIITLNTRLGNDASPTDKLIINGDARGATTLIVNNAGGEGAATQTGIQIVEVAGANANGADTFRLGNTPAAGAYIYSLHLAPDNNWYLRSNATLNPRYAPSLNTAAEASAYWFTSLDNLHKRMGDLRQTEPGAQSLVDNTWVRISSRRTNARLPINGAQSYRATDYSIDAGLDHAWRADNTRVFYTGVFLGATASDRDFQDARTGKATSGHVGAYATWLHRDGWYADLVFKADFTRHGIDDTTGSIRYNTRAPGLSLEFGRTFKRTDGWWCEPSIQVATSWNSSATYEQPAPASGAPSTISIDSAHATQYRGLLRFGRQYKDSNWHPYAKIGATRAATNGGALTVENASFDANLDGWSAIFGAGLQYALGRDAQLYLDYDYSKSPRFERPWALNLGWRKNW